MAERSQIDQGRASGISQTNECAEAVLVASRVLVGIAARSLADRDEEISLLQYRALVLLGTGGIERPMELAQSLGVTASAATRLCDRLVKKRLISRRRLGRDRRLVHLALSSSGRALLEEVMSRRRTELRAIVSRLAPEMQVHLADAFDHFAAAAGEIAGDVDNQTWDLLR